MNEGTKEAVVILCKCGKHHKTYGIRAEKHGCDKWVFTWAFPVKDAVAQREGYTKSSVKGNISFGEEYPGCPYCGESNLTVCSCGRLNCTAISDGLFTCEWCGSQGTTSNYAGAEIIAGTDL